MCRYLWSVLGALSQLINAIAGGSQFETICARLHRNQHILHLNIIRSILNGIFFWQDDHCQWSYRQGLRAANIAIKRKRSDANA